MKVAIVNNWVPFIYGGAEFLADHLKKELINCGHNVIVVRVPFQWNPSEKILDHMLAARLLKLDNADKVIALKFPAYYIEHPNKSLWLLHQFRQAYDMWGTPYQDIPSTPQGLGIRQAIINADNFYLKKAKKIFTNSKIVGNRLRNFNQIDSEVLYPPLMDSEKFSPGEFGDYLFYPSRLSHAKRQHLIIESMRFTRSNVKLIIAGNPDAPSDLTLLEELIKKYNLETKVKLIGRWITLEEKVNYFTEALGAIYIPYDEDSYGYVSLEAFHSHKPVLTCSDSGGTLELIEDGVNGLIAEPTPQSLAESMDILFEDKSKTKKMGKEGYHQLISMKLNWTNVVEKLIQ